MEKVTYTMEVPKEAKEVVDAALAIVAHFVQGKSLEEAMSLLPVVMNAVNGLDKIGDEIKSELKEELVAYMVVRTWESLQKPQQ